MTLSDQREAIEIHIMQSMWKSMEALAELHKSRTGHTVWVHRRKYDIALACWDCTGGKPQLPEPKPAEQIQGRIVDYVTEPCSDPGMCALGTTHAFENGEWVHVIETSREKES